MPCNLCINSYEDLIAKLYNNEKFAFDTLLNHDLLHFANTMMPEGNCPRCPTIACIYNKSTFTLSCPQCPFKTLISTLATTSFVFWRHVGDVDPNILSIYFRFINLFLQDFLSEKFTLENYHISKNIFNQWLLHLLNQCNEWMNNHQTRIGGNGIYVDIEVRSVDLKKKDGETRVLWVFKATERMNEKDGEGIVATQLTDRNTKTIIAQLEKSVLPSSHLYFTDKATCDAIKTQKCSTYSNFVLHHEAEFDTKHSMMEIFLLTKFWEDLDSYVSQSENREECPDQHFARYIFLSRYCRKETVLHHFLRALAKLQKITV